jgi:hypothetical protein
MREENKTKEKSKRDEGEIEVGRKNNVINEIH